MPNLHAEKHLTAGYSVNRLTPTTDFRNPSARKGTLEFFALCRAFSIAGIGPPIVTGTDVSVTFSGKASTTIAAGAAATSDTINVAITAQDENAVSIFLPGAAPIDHITFSPGRLRKRMDRYR